MYGGIKRGDDDDGDDSGDGGGDGDDSYGDDSGDETMVKSRGGFSCQKYITKSIFNTQKSIYENLHIYDYFTKANWLRIDSGNIADK